MLWLLPVFSGRLADGTEQVGEWPWSGVLLWGPLHSLQEPPAPDRCEGEAACLGTLLWGLVSCPPEPPGKGRQVPRGSRRTRADSQPLLQFSLLVLISEKLCEPSFVLRTSGEVAREQSLLSPSLLS